MKLKQDLQNVYTLIKKKKWSIDTADRAYQSKNGAVRSEPAELRDRIVSQHRSGKKLQKIYCIEGFQSLEQPGLVLKLAAQPYSATVY